MKDLISMDENTREAIIITGALVAFFGICYVYITARHRERMSKLEKGIETSPLDLIKVSNTQTLKYGMLAVGIAVGMLISECLNWGDDRSSHSLVGMILLFGGLSWVLNYYITKKHNK